MLTGTGEGGRVTVPHFLSVGTGPVNGVAPASAWRFADFVMAVTLGTMLFSIVRVPLLPIAPGVFMPFLLCWACRGEIVRWRGPLWHIGALRALLYLYAAGLVFEVATRPLGYEIVAQTGRVVAGAFLLVGLTAYVLGGGQRAGRVVGVLLASSIVSAVWFLGEISLEEPFIGIRRQLYADIYLGFPREIVESIRTGLTPFNHLLGYHLAAALPLLAVSMMLAPRLAGKVSAAVVGAGLLVTLYFSGQRSALLALVLGGGAAFLWGRRKLRTILSLPIMGGACTLAGLAILSELWIPGVLPATLGQKVISEEGWRDIVFRLLLQLKALELIFTNPLGLPIAGLHWETAGFWPVYESSPGSVIMDRAIAVHNGYLNLPLNLGVFALAPVVVLLWLILKYTHRLLVSAREVSGSTGYYRQALAAAALGLLFPQAMTHNASLLTREPASMAIFCLLVAGEIRWRTGERTVPAAHGSGNRAAR